MDSREILKHRIDAMKYILEYYEDMRFNKTEQSALRACYNKISELEETEYE